MGTGLTPLPPPAPQRCTETPTCPGSITVSLAHETPPTINRMMPTASTAPTALRMLPTPLPMDLQPTRLAPPRPVIEHIDLGICFPRAFDAASRLGGAQLGRVLLPLCLGVTVAPAAIGAQPHPPGHGHRHDARA